MIKSSTYHKSASNYYWQASWRTFFLFCINLINASSLVFVLLFGGISLQFLVNNDQNSFYLSLGINAGIFFIFAITSVFGTYYKYSYEQNLSHQIRKDLIHYLTKLKNYQYHSLETGVLHNWLINDTNEIANIYTDRLVTSIQAITSLLLVLVFVVVSPGRFVGLGLGSNYL